MVDTKLSQYLLSDLIFSVADMPDHFHQASETLDNLHTYAIVNGAGNDDVLMNLVSLEPEHRILFDGDDADKLEEAAPWLVKIIQDEPFTEWLLEECFGKRLVLFLQSPEEIERLTAHFKTYTKIEFPDKQNPDNWQMGYFSFYDPSIFPTWVKSLNQEEALQFCSPLHNVWYEENEQLNLFYLKNEGWQEVPFTLLKKQDTKQAGEVI